MHANRSVSTKQFAMQPAHDVPRSSFHIQKTHKTTFDAGYLIPIYCKEVLPGDTFQLKGTFFCRLAPTVFPVMDNLHLETQYFFVPCRLVWENFQKFMGEQVNPADSISYVIPTVTIPAGGYAPKTLQDYFGLPTVGQVSAAETVDGINALPLRCYNLIYNQWYRDENLQNSLTVPLTDGPDSYALYTLKRRGKRHDYFTSCLPWTQKGGVAVTLPLGSTAPVKGIGWIGTAANPTAAAGVKESGGTTASYTFASFLPEEFVTKATTGDAATAFPDIYTDLNAATSATINLIRTAFQMQRFLERDARGGTRYTEIVWSHFRVRSPDERLQRAEYLGGGSTPISIHPVANTTGTAETPQGSLAAFGTTVAHHGFSQSFTEHGYVIGLVSVRADLTYQQGLHKMWSRSTRYDFYWPVFQGLGEQAVLNKEIYVTGLPADDEVFGYQERYAEYRYDPSMITGLFRSTTASNIDPWHLAQEFGSLPTLAATFIEDTPPVERVVAVGAEAEGQQFLCDAFFDLRAARPIPMYGVPGMVDHF